MLKAVLSPLCIICLCLLVAPAPALAQRGNENLVTNGDFSAGTNDRGEPVGWHTQLTSIIPVPEYEDPEKKERRTGEYRFRCGCGEFWPGTVRPWAQLRCPHCGHTNIGLGDSGDLYFDNHERVELTRDGRRHAVHVTVEAPGTRVISDLIEAERDAGYELSFMAIASGTPTRVWVEGFRAVDDEQASAWVESLPEDANPHEQTRPLRRVFRRQVNSGSPEQWERFTEILVAPDRHQFDYMLVSLYAYGRSGEAAFTDVSLRKLTPRELRRYQQENPAPDTRR